jgi:hypothetical protein
MGAWKCAHHAVNKKEFLPLFAADSTVLNENLVSKGCNNKTRLGALNAPIVMQTQEGCLPNVAANSAAL